MIDFDFLKSPGIEGWSSVPYVPMCNGRVIGFSGITVGNGFDIGQHNAADLFKAGVRKDLVEKLLPFLGVKGMEAFYRLEKAKKIIEEPEVLELSTIMTDHKAKEFIKIFDERSRSIKWAELPDDIQTILYSLFHAYGYRFPYKHNTFKQVVGSKDVKEIRKVLIDNLMDYGDKALDQRHKREAAYLSK